MITPDYCRLMARYNRWQNRSLYAAADTLDDDARRLDRGAFFGSIHGTLSHLIWGDHAWMSRLDGWDAPKGGIGDTQRFVEDWDELRSKRRITDARISRWADGLRPADLAGPFAWYSAAAQRQVETTRAICAVHFFNHQTHHRGQVHAMLTAAGARPPEDTDLALMPDQD